MLMVQITIRSAGSVRKRKAGLFASDVEVFNEYFLILPRVATQDLQLKIRPQVLERLFIRIDPGIYDAAAHGTFGSQY
jgi:hypothetical protein